MMEGSRCAFKVDEEERLDLYSDCSVDLTTKNQKRQVSSIGDSRELLELERIRRLLPDPELQAQKPSAVKKARREEAFDKEREKNRRRLQMNLPFCQSLSETLSKELREKLQGIVDTALQSAIEAHYCPSGYQTTKALVLEKKREVVYIGLGFRFVLTVNNYRCSKCPLSADRITVHPYQVGCVPTSPTVNCETWISLDYCKLFGNLQATSKVSANAFIKATYNVEAYLRPGTVLRTSKGEVLPAGRLRDEQLKIATTEFSKVESEETFELL